MKYRIEKNVPLPDRYRSGWRRNESELSKVMARMVVGDSVLIPAAERKDAQNLAMCYRIKITVKANSNNSKVRIWRIE